MAQRWSAFGPGKVILLGEHGVVYGHRAIAGALSRGISAEAVEAKRPSLQIPDGTKPAHAKALQRAFRRALPLCGAPSVTVSISSELPLSMGLGSSGALSVAIARVLLSASGRSSQKNVEAVALEMEREFHGTPSGLDHTTSARGGLVAFRKGKAQQLECPKPLKVLVVLAGERPATKETVTALRERQAVWPTRYRRLFAEIDRLAVEGITAIRSGDLPALGDIMNVNQGLLAALQVSGGRIDDMVRRLRSMGALGAKLTGAGGDGGAVVALFREPEQAVMELRREGITCFASQLAGPRAL